MFREVEIEGCFNARDLGGIPVNGGLTRSGCFFRSDSIDHLTVSGWKTVQNLGIGEIIDLRDPSEIKNGHRPDWVRWHNIPYDGPRDAPFWKTWCATRDGLGTPIFYEDQLGTYPELSQAALSILAKSETPALFHCAAGRDRTGLLTLIILSIVGVETDAIIADYLLSEKNLNGMYARDGLDPQKQRIEEFLAANETTHGDLLKQARVAVDKFIATLDADIIDGIRSKLAPGV